MKGLYQKWIGVIALLLAVGFAPRIALAHCDTLDGPVVNDARIALSQGDVTPVLKWVTPANEQQIRTAFADTLKVRQLSPTAKDLADMYFFETLVRIHRAGEGAPYTGLKPAGTAVEPAIEEADIALHEKQIDPLIARMTNEIANGIRQRFTRVQQTQAHANESVAAGREYVEAYVEYIHYIERLHLAATGKTGHSEEGKAEQHEE